MSRFVIILVATALLMPSLALAKRTAPAKVEPVIHQGIRYIAPNDDGRRAYIEAWDVRTNKRLWDLTIFTNRIDPKLEEDVQWVFIRTLSVQDGTLIVTSEGSETYRVDLKTKAVNNPGGLTAASRKSRVVSAYARFEPRCCKQSFVRRASRSSEQTVI